MKIHVVRVKLFHAGGQTDMTKVIITFHNFANAPKNQNTPSVTQSPPNSNFCSNLCYLFYVTNNFCYDTNQWEIQKSSRTHMEITKLPVRMKEGGVHRG